MYPFEWVWMTAKSQPIKLWIFLASGKVNTISHNRVISNWMLLCFGFALLRNMIGVELKHTPYFKSATLKTKSNRNLGHLRFLTLRADNLFCSSSWLYSFDFPLVLVLQHSTEMPSQRRPSSLGIKVKPLNCSLSRFWFNTVLSSLQRVLFIKWLSAFPLMTDTPSSACSNTSLLLQLLGYLRKSTCRFSFYLGWRLII